MKKKITNLRILVSAISFAVAAIFLATSYELILPIFGDRRVFLNVFILAISVISLVLFAVWVAIFIKDRRKARDEL